jgi:hypothetical protein
LRTVYGFRVTAMKENGETPGVETGSATSQALVDLPLVLSF